eukprot:gene9618-9779_t
MAVSDDDEMTLSQQEAAWQHCRMPFTSVAAAAATGHPEGSSMPGRPGWLLDEQPTGAAGDVFATGGDDVTHGQEDVMMASLDQAMRPEMASHGVGVKLRVVGAELSSDRAAEPLEAARWATVKLCYNGVSPEPWDAKLGPVPLGQNLR